MIVRTFKGVVSSKIGRDLTVLLENGSKVELKVVRTSLVLGDTVHIAYDNTTGEVVSVHADDEVLPDPTLVEPPPPVIHPDLEENPLLDSEGSVLGNREVMEY